MLEAKARVEAGIVSNSSLTWGFSSYLFSSCIFIYLQQVQDVLKGSMAELQQSSLDRTLLVWCQEATKVII
jgi:hypothetical protein